ncbi:hypothetical protein [Pandoraea pnomenusa]|uniref:hypothetical protein n=1 Tax=Pandoraea pnomenusa TaxID=93220 RepID=UPI00333EBD22
MRSTPHHRAIVAPPRYGSAPMPDSRRKPCGFRKTFEGAQSARARCRHSAPVQTGTSAPRTAWPSAFAILLVANLAAPVMSGIPRHVSLSSNRDPAPQDPTSPDIACTDVSIEPAPRVVVKSDYSRLDVLKAVAAARMPFSRTSESIIDAYELVSGHEVAPGVRASVHRIADTIDVATGLVPDVQLLRLPSEAADMAVDEMEGRLPDSDRLAAFIQMASARAPVSRISEYERPHVEPDASGAFPGKSSEPVGETPVDAISGTHTARAPSEVTATRGRTETSGGDGTSGHPPPDASFTILGEAEHLEGYQQRLADDALPPGEPSRLLRARGILYLRGNAGYYRASRGPRDDHWLIDSPRRDRAQVPVTYDPATRQWQAHPALRLCGGGCAPSRPISPDSIAGSYEDIFEATRNLPDASTQEAIQNSFADLGLMRLLRSNRADLRAMRDNSIVGHRIALRAAMTGIDRNAPLPRQQRLAAEATAVYYFSRPFAEAFCHENAEILFHFLLQDGVKADHLRMVTVQPNGRSPHVMVLYTESHHFIDMLDASTPQPPVPLHRDGITSDEFAWSTYMTRDTTVLLDPWSRSKAISFAQADRQEDVVAILDAAFADIGHQRGGGYTVSVTRPLNPVRSSASSHASHTSLGSVGSSGAVSRESSGSASSASDKSSEAASGRTAKVPPRPDRHR